MKKVMLILMVLLIAAPAMAVVNIVLEQVGTDCDPATVVVKYDASGATGSELPRAFALDITCDSGAQISAISAAKWGESTNAAPGYGVFMGSIDYANIASDPADSNYWGNPRATDAGAKSTGTLPQSDITIEMGSLYDPDVSADAPLAGSSGNEVTLCTLTIDSECTITVTPNVARGADQGVVLEDGNDEAIASTPLALSCGWVYPDSWGYSGDDYKTQCYGDVNGDASVALLDFYDLRDSWNKSYPDASYIPNIDVNRDGSVGLVDFYAIRDNWNQSVTSDCLSGDWNNIYGP